MNSNKDYSEERIRKVTEVIQKFWWFCFYLVILPFLSSLIFFYIFQLFIKDVRIVLGFSILLNLFLILILFRNYDINHRKNSFFKNAENNIITRINTIFLISIVSFIITPIIILINPKIYLFELFPLLSFIIFFNIIWYYFHFKPIDVYYPAEKRFKRISNFKLSFLQPHNLILILYYLIHILFLSIILYTKISWIFLIVSNIIFYFFTIKWTKNLRYRIRKAIRKNELFLEDLISIQKKIVISITSLLFVVLIQIPIILLAYPIPNVQYTYYTTIFLYFLIIIFCLFCIKLIIYINFHYNNRFINLEKLERTKEIVPEKLKFYQKCNTFLTITLILLLLGISILVNLLIIVLIFLPFIYVLGHYEQKEKYNIQKYNNFIYLFNTAIILGIISFGILPSIFEILLLNGQFIVFLLLLYFTLEIFVKVKSFTKENVRLFQNFIAVACYFLIVYSLYPFFFLEYINFTKVKSIIFVSTFLINFIITLVILLISFYRLYPLFREKFLKTFNRCINLNLFSILLVIFILIGIRLFFLIDYTVFIYIMMVLTILFPLFFVLFLFFNYLVKILNKHNLLTGIYYSCWFLICSTTFWLLIIFYNFIYAILLILAIFSRLFYYQLRFGKKIEKIKESRFKWFVEVNFYFFITVLFCFCASFFLTSFSFLNLMLNIFLSLYISLILTCFFVNILFKKELFVTKTINEKFNIITLFYSSFLSFYLVLLFTLGTFYVFVFPLIALTLALYIPMIYMLKKRIHQNLIRAILTINTFVLSLTLILIPTIVGLELFRLGLSVNIFLVILATALLMFIFSKILSFIPNKTNLKQLYVVYLKIYEILLWLFITCLISINLIVIFFITFPQYQFILLYLSLSFSCFFGLNIYNLKQISSLKKIFSEKKELLLKYIKLYDFFEYFRNFTFFGLIISISLIFSSALNVNYISILFQRDLLYVGIIIFSLVFFSFTLGIIIMCKALIKIELSKYTNHFEFISWLGFKFCLSLFITLISFSLSITNKICFGLLIFSLLTPVSIYFSQKAKINIETYKFLIIKLFSYIIFIITIVFYIELFLFFTYNKSVPFLYNNIPILLSLLTVNLFLFFKFCYSRFKYNFQTEPILKIYYYYGLIGLLFFSLLYINPVVSLILLGITFLILLYYRNTNFISRIILYFLLSYIFFIDLFTLFFTFSILDTFESISINFYTIICLITIISVLSSSILLNLKKNNFYEKYALFLIISLFSFIFFLTYTNILIIYNTTISIFIFFILIGFDLYYRKDSRYKSFVKPCILLFIFDFISWISYSFLFIDSIYLYINPTLTFSLTSVATLFMFIILYNKSPEPFRSKTFSIALPSIIFFFPLFIGFYLISYFPIKINPIIATIIAINFGILLFYFSIGIYQWKLSWSIWKTGWYMWNIMPFINFVLIYNIVRGINLYANAIQIWGDFDFALITFIICILVWLPAGYEWLKDHFFLVLFIVWGVSLFLIYYVSLNLFIGIFPLVNIFFVLSSILCLVPLLYNLKYWKILSITWLFLGLINILFFWFYLQSFGIFRLEILVPISILIFGLFFHIYSFFPNIMKFKSVLIILSYSISLSGIFLTILFILNTIIMNFFISINIAFVIIASALFSSRYIKLNRKLINLLATWIFIVNVSLLTLNTFNLIPGMLIFAIFMGVSVFGGSFFVFNYFKIIGPINKAIPWMIICFGVSASISSLFFIFFQINLYLFFTIYFCIILLFLYFILGQYKLMMIYLIPIPFAFLLLHILFVYKLFLNFDILIGLMFYLIFFQILYNGANYSLKNSAYKEKILFLKLYTDKNRINLTNFILFILISTSITLFITITIPIILYYQILLFLIVWPILILFCLKYFKVSKLDLIYHNFTEYLNILNILLYFLIPFSICANILLNLMQLRLELRPLMLIILISFNGILFVETSVLDKFVFKFLKKTNNQYIVLFSWGIFCNCASFLIFLIYPNYFFLILLIMASNLITVYFFKKINIKREKQISKIRLALIYVALTTLAFYIASLISEIVIFYNVSFVGIPSIFLFFLLSFSILYVFSYIFNIKIKIELKNCIELFIFLSIQVFLFLLYYSIVFEIMKTTSFFTIILFILIESFLSYVTVNYFGKIAFKKKFNEFLTASYSLITFLIYIEVCLIFYILFVETLGLFGGLLISQLAFFTLTIFDKFLIKKLNKAICYLLNSLSYIFISILLFVFLIQTFDYYFIYIWLLILILMQFYSNYSVFSFLKDIKTNRINLLNKGEILFRNIIGTIFYVISIVFLQSLISLMPIEFQFLLLSLIIHGITIIDKYILEFLGKYVNYFRFTSWIFIMIFSSIYLFWIFNTYFYNVLTGVIPLIIIIFTIELFYLVNLLKFFQKIKLNRDKVKKALVFVIYIDFISWPLYFSRLDSLLLLNLFIISIIILFLTTYIDNYFQAFSEKLRIFLRKSSFLCTGILLSIDTFLILEFIIMEINPFFNIIVNICTASLIFLFFLAFIIKPFNKHSILAMVYWNLSFLILSVIIYYIFLSLQIGLFFFLITFVIYWFVFTLERLRELFGKLIDLISRILKNFKLLISKVIIICVNFFKKQYKKIWIIISAFIAILFAYFVYSFLELRYLIPLTLAVFGVLYAPLPSKKIDDPDKMFWRRIKKLIIIWGCAIVLIYLFIPIAFLVLMIFVGITILGAIIIIYINYEEKRLKISIKWKFYTTLFFVIILIITIILLIIQFVTFLTID